MKRGILISAVLLCAWVAGATGYYRQLLMLPRAAVSAAADPYWTDPYSLNEIGTTLLIDWPTNTVTTRGSIGSAWDAGSTNGVATAHVISNTPTASTGPVWSNVGTNSLGDISYGWLFPASSSVRIDVSDKDDLTLASEGADIPFTIYGWAFLTNATANGVILAKEKEWSIDYNAANRRLRSVRVSRLSSATNIITSAATGSFTNNQWTHFVVTCAGGLSTNKIYMDSIERTGLTTKDNVYKNMTNGVDNVRLGSSFGGRLAYVGVIRTNLSPVEVTNLFIGFGGTNGPGAAIRKRVPAGAYP